MFIRFGARLIAWASLQKLVRSKDAGVGLVKIFLTLLLLVVLVDTASPLTWYVAAEVPVAGDGSLANPFDTIASGMAAAADGDTVRLAAGTYSATVATSAYGNPRLALLVLKDGVTVIGAGRKATFLHALSAPTLTFGITAENVNASASVSDLTVSGACFHGVNLRSSSPTFERMDLVNDVTGGSSVACDVRDLSYPVFQDVVFNGGHSGLVVEFGAGGVYTDCEVGVRPNDGLICNNGTPEFVNTDFLGAGRDVLVFAQGAQPIVNGCRIADGGQFVVRVAVYLPGSEIDLGGNDWFSSDPMIVRSRIQDALVDPLLGATVVIEPFGSGEVALESTSLGTLKALYR